MTSLTIRVPDRIRALLGMLDTELTPAQFVAWIGPNVGHPEVQAFAREVLAPPRPSDATATLDMGEKLAEVETALASAREEIARLTAERERGGDLAAELRAIAAEARTAARTIPGLADVFETRAAGIDAALKLATERLAAKGGAR